ncbi:unnamed protein product [Ilex paraguariensis]|uniref:protein disulfide-isomerase n=1 Tax=Ilex paraguariensis TaxID=185542 RepID=A0ABC8R290_9AQUA
MSRSRICIALLATLTLCLFSSTSADDVVVLTEDNFEKEVGQDRGALVEFYAPWCGHCKKLAPDYEKLGASFKKAKSVLIGKVDCDEHKSLCSKYGVSGYPTIQWFPKGSLEPKKYESSRTAEALAEFVNNEGEEALAQQCDASSRPRLFSQRLTMASNETHCLVGFLLIGSLSLDERR